MRLLPHTAELVSEADDGELLLVFTLTGVLDEGRLTVEVARGVEVVAFTIETLASPSFDEEVEEVVELEGVDDWAIADEVSCKPADGVEAASLTLETFEEIFSLTLVVTIVIDDGVLDVLIVLVNVDTGVVTALLSVTVECGRILDNFIGVTVDVISLILGIPFLIDPFNPEPGKLIILDDVTVNGVAVAP